jgi:ribonucleoside-triphosphate reductase (formate)
MVSKIRKRDGSIVFFQEDKIAEAIWKAVKAVGGTDRERPKEICKLITQEINKRYGEHGIPDVEEVQDLVEKVLIEEGHAKVAKAYILYRKSHEELRNVKGLFDTIEAVEDYIGLNDWMVKENSNMGFSLQGLNNYIATKIISNYWMRRVYPEAIRKAHEAGDIHVHDLGTLGAYCVGWDLKDLLTVGFKGVRGKVESKPAKHLRTALGHIVNFFYTLQGETAGAQAFSNFDTLLAPFVKKDNLSYLEVKQIMQEFVFNLAVPTRVGFQCMSEDTEILTPNGWRGYNDLKKGDIIKTFNLIKKTIENKPINNLFVKEYRGLMYNLKNRISDQLISPGHRVVRKKFQSDDYVLEEIEKVREMKSPFIVPIAAENNLKDAGISNEKIKLMAWIIAEGSIERPGKHRCCHRISIYQSAIRNNSNYKEIKELLDFFKLNYSEYTQHGLGSPVQRFRLDADSSKKIHIWFGTKESIHFLPEILLNMSQKQSELFLNTYIKAEGFEECKIATTDLAILDSLQQIAVNAEYGFTVLIRKPTIGSKPVFVLRIIKHKETYIKKIEKVKYSGIIWCPNTDNETVIARRNGKVFITGNTPFTNITMDLKVPDYMKDEHVVIGGQPQIETYKEFEKEMKMINKAFCEVMLEGDASGQVFTFPIPTYNITKDFDWDNPEYHLIWEMTAKYGIPYFSNFVNSDMKPEDARSMCCRLRLNQSELRKRGGGLFGANPQTGSIGVVTVNMPRLGYVSISEEDFFNRLDRLMELSKESLEIKRKAIEKFTEVGLYPYSKFYLRQVNQRFGQYWKNHFATIGLLGMNEAIMNFMPGENITTPRGREFALKVLDFMRDRISGYQEETGNIYNLEATPGEGTTYRFARLDKKRFGRIVVANENAFIAGAKPYYTNSTQLPVNYTHDIFEALDLQDDFQCKYTGGTVFHTYVGERLDKEGVKKLVKKISASYHMPYFTITPTFSICPIHGYIPGEHEYCPKCDEEFNESMLKVDKEEEQISYGDEAEDVSVKKTDEILDSQLKRGGERWQEQNVRYGAGSAVI